MFAAIPYHPLFVHIPVVMVPLAAIGAIATVIKPAWYMKYRWLLLIGAALAAVGTLLADNTGESLEGTLSDAERQAIHDHAEAGGLANIMTVLFFLAVAAYVVVPWYLRRKSEKSGQPAAGWSDGPAWLRPVLSGLVVLLGVVSFYTVFLAGHSGAEEVWEDASGTATAPTGSL